MNIWATGEGYEPYIGRWSRLVAQEFLDWLGISERRRWLDVGCGTGALTQSILARATPEKIVSLDQSPGYVAFARSTITDSEATFLVADAKALPAPLNSFDAVVSGLVLNSIADPRAAIAEMARVAAPGGSIAAYVWDYAEDMQIIRFFWDAAAALFPAARALDEGARFPICQPAALTDLFTMACDEVITCEIVVGTPFPNFEDYWTPFLGGQGPAPSFVASLTEDERLRLRESLRASLPAAADGSINLMARAWAVKGTKG